MAFVNRHQLRNQVLDAYRANCTKRVGKKRTLNVSVADSLLDKVVQNAQEVSAPVADFVNVNFAALTTDFCTAVFRSPFPPLAFFTTEKARWRWRRTVTFTKAKDPVESQWVVSSLDSARNFDPYELWLLTEEGSVSPDVVRLALSNKMYPNDLPAPKFQRRISRGR